MNQDERTDGAKGEDWLLALGLQESDAELAELIQLTVHELRDGGLLRCDGPYNPSDQAIAETSQEPAESMSAYWARRDAELLADMLFAGQLVNFLEYLEYLEYLDMLTDAEILVVEVR